MTLTFYKTGFDVTKNGVYEDLETFLDKGIGVTQVLALEYKHIDPALSVTVKLPVDSHQFSKKNIGDYCKAVDEDGTIYYYYVMNCQWKGRETLLVTLGLDTLNTFWKEISSSWSPETHITRRFKDRFHFTSTGQYAYITVDDKDESFGAVPMLQTKKLAVNPDASKKKWTLVYKTVYEQSESNIAQNPVECFAYPSVQTTTSTGAAGTVTWDSSMFAGNVAYAMSTSDNPDGWEVVTDTGWTFSSSGQTDTASSVIYILYSSTYNRFYVKQSDTTYDVSKGSGTSTFMSHEGATVTIKKGKVAYKQAWEYADRLFQDSNYENFWPKAGKLDMGTPLQINAGEASGTLISFNDWYINNKTDGRLVKIRELPYAPFQETYNSDGTMKLPSGWEVRSQGLHFIGTKFGSYRLGATKNSAFKLARATDIVDQAPNIKFETKLYNSAYYADKLVYDNSVWTARWERVNETGRFASDAMSITVYYSVSDGMDNGMLFRIATDFSLDTDFGDYMLVSKSTDVPYYTNEYLNYLRYGKSVDEKAAGLNIASSVVSGVGSAASTVASFAFSGATVGSAGGPFGAGAGAVVGAIVGLASTAMSVAKTCATAYDTINSKIDAYTHQASSVNGTSDLSLFNIYSGNKLLNFVYEPIPEIKQMLYNYFRLYGYADDAYEIPTFTRRYVDYLKCEPSFVGDLLWNDFLDDIRQRMAVGFRVFHYVNAAYDLRFEKENWETSIWSWANGN